MATQKDRAWKYGKEIEIDEQKAYKYKLKSDSVKKRAQFTHEERIDNCVTLNSKT